MEMKMTVNEKGKRRILAGHPWVFRSDVEISPDIPAGIVSVFDGRKKFLGQALFSPASQITLRMLTPRREPIGEEFWKKRIEQAADLRESLSLPSNAYRLVYGESDGIPSFILDRYGEAFVFQLLSAGLETRREVLLKLVREIFSPSLLVERNDVSVRSLEGLPLSSQVVEGSSSTRVTIEEDTLRFEVDLLEGQKTGAFLDQRDNRLQASKWARGKKRILDAFCYQGWFSCAMAKEVGEVVAVDQSPAACEQVENNARLNRLQNIQPVERNVFDFLKEADRRKEKFDLINLDPPAFVKSRTQLAQAVKGYKEINLRALKLLEKGGLLITSSCSHHLSEEEFLKLLRDAAHDTQRTLQILKIGRQASDHPILLSFPESNYLKCLFLRVV